MESAKFAEALRIVNVKTPITDGFEKEYGQKDNRWWDKSTGSQKEHLICWFSRKQYGGSTSECIDKNYPSICKRCCFAEWEYKPEGFGEQRDAKLVFTKMRKPEMYIYIAEALGILKKEELKNLVDQIKAAIDNNESWKKVVNEELPWVKVEKRVRSILEEE